MRFFLMLLVLCSSVVYSETIMYPDCNINERLKTPIKLYLPTKILSVKSKEDVYQSIQKWVDFSNRALRNSCIPMERYISSIEFLDAIDNSWFQSLSATKALLTLNLSSPPLELNDKSIPSFVGVIFESYKFSHGQNNCGLSSDDGNFFVAALDCADFVMEHEIGHLIGAHHDHKSILSKYPSLDAFEQTTYPRVKPFSYGWRCGGYGTVMSFSPKKLAAYSSPELKVGDSICGDELSGDNARVMREYAIKHLNVKK
ncbi:hypothetical protein [Psychromonas sp.]|uniref:hypothetical protein n=1 Tax=Psychromonas sp. TaxID=1884585 RepID=UPI003A975220